LHAKGFQDFIKKIERFYKDFLPFYLL